jgi:hypothetical protein
MADDDTVSLPNLVTFNVGELPEDGIALLLGYSTSQEELSRREIPTIVFGMTREQAAQLGSALVAIAGKPPSGDPPTRQRAN